MNKAIKLTYEGGMNQDLSRSKHPPNFYFEGRNIRFVATEDQSTGSITNEKGNEFILTIPQVTINSNTRDVEYIINESVRTISYQITPNTVRPRSELEEQYGITESNLTVTSGNQTIVGWSAIREHFILITTDNNGFDCIWKLHEKTFDLELLYVRNLNLSTQFPVQIISNFENELIQKIYWVDSKNQLRFINTKHSIENGDNEELIDLSSTLLNQVGDYSFSQPEIIDKVSGGIHTAGMIQYAYNLYNVNSSQTTISPLTELVSLDKGIGNGGGDVNEVVGTIPVIRMSNLDPNYSNLKLYAIKYTSLNEIPQISLIADTSVSNLNEFTYFDDGNIIQSISLEEFVFLGTGVIVPQHIEAKDSRLFLANYKEENFNIDLDCRAYSFNSGGQAIVANRFITLGSNNLVPNDTRVLSTPNPLYSSIPKEHSTININYDLYKYDETGNLGGEGPYLKYNLTRTQLATSGKHFKDDEIYRIGIEFYNNKGQYTLPQWIADLKGWIENNESNLSGYYSGLEVTLKPAFYTWLNDDNNFLNDDGVFDESLKPVGYKILRANRDLKDRSILFQGMINPMMSLAVSDSNHGDGGVLDGLPSNSPNILEADQGLKMPSLMRRFDAFLCPMRRCNNYAKLNGRTSPGFTHPQVKPGSNYHKSREVYSAVSSSHRIANYYQYNQMMQLYSPDLLFNSISNISATRLKVLGGIMNNTNSFWGQERDIFTQEIKIEGKTFNSISPHDVKAVGSNLVELNGNILNLLDFGYIAGTARPDTDADDLMVFNQLYREYHGNFHPRPNGASIYSFYGRPIVSEKGQGRTTYNNDSNFVFSNSWEPVITDGSGSTGAGSDRIRPLRSINSWGAKCLTFVLGDNNVDPYFRTDIRDLQQNGLSNIENIGLIGEITIENDIIYLGNLYGGNTYESKRRTNYIGIGSYQPINEHINTIQFPGDTFISEFKFTKLSKTDTEIYDNTVAQFTEIVSFKVETSVDLKNRNDESFFDWDNRFQPRYDDYHKYNRVYSQQGSLILKRDVEFNFKPVDFFDTNVIATKLKSPGETIDSWTELLPNEVLTLDGQYGPITGLVNAKDEIFALQENAFTFLSINPRVQVQASDGVSVELGYGSVLQEYRYIDTNSGTLDKWSILSSPNAVYYYDHYNKALKMYQGQNTKLSTLKGLKVFFDKNTTFGGTTTKPFVNKDISVGYDYINDEVIFTFISNNKPFTLTYNENTQTFISFYDYKPSFYISRGDNLLATSPNNRSIYKQFAGEYNNFFGTYYPSYITLMVNPEPDFDCVFDNIMYKSEMYLDDVDQPDKTLTHIQAFNEYQDSGLVPLEFGRNKNLRRKFRNWTALIPRQQRNRIRNPWIYLKLQLDNQDNYKMILHDTVIAYTV
jgi:hypothetical protein